jgi:hypothetical protein
MKKTLLTSIAALLLATGTAHAMNHDFSNTWCACNIPNSAQIDRVHYYAWIEKCHRRHHTAPLYAQPCDLNEEPPLGHVCKPWKHPRVCPFASGAAEGYGTELWEPYREELVDPRTGRTFRP